MSWKRIAHMPPPTLGTRSMAWPPRSAQMPRKARSLADVFVKCEECEGRRFQAAVLDYTFGGLNIAQR